MDPNEIITYLEQKAAQFLGHEIGGTRCQFFVIDNPYELSEFDDALRNTVRVPAMLVEGEDGVISGNQSANNTDTMNFSFMILDKRNGRESIRDVRNRCKAWGVQVITQIRKERISGIVAGKVVTFDLNCPYSPVGPINTDCWGYHFSLQFIVPITF